MPHSSNQDDARNFVKDLSYHVDLDVEENIPKMSDEDCVVFVREFIHAMAAWQPQAFDLEGEPTTAAAHAVYLAKLFPPAFQRAYVFSNNYLNAQNSIKKAFE